MVFSGGGEGASAAISRARLAIRVVKGRWFMVYACLLIMAGAGATYIFSIYSGDIKSSLGYNQKTLNTMSFFKDLGSNVGIVSGLINEVAPPWVVLLMGAGMNLFGYLMIFLAITGRIARPAVWQMCVFICVGANSQTFANTGALVTCVKNFPESRGVVLGLLKCFVGLSGAIYTQIYSAVYGEDSKSLVLLIAWLPAAISIFFVYTIRIMPATGASATASKPFYYFIYLAVANGTYLMVVIIVDKLITFSRPEQIANGTFIIFLLFLPITVVVWEELRIKKEGNEDSESKPPKAPVALAINSSGDKHSQEYSTGEKEPKSATASCLAEIFRPPARGEDYSILQALVSIDMIVLFLASICGVGGTLTAIDNMGQIGQSLGYPSRSINTFVSLISIWNAMGRLASGYSSEILISRYKLPRPLMLTFVLLLACVGHLLIAFGVPNSLYVASVIIGFCFGAQWPLLFAIISEIFGLKYYSTLYNFGGVASPIGSYILNVIVTGHLYDREAERQNAGHSSPARSGGKDLTCIGVNCFRESFLIIVAVTVIGAVISLVLVFRTRKFYRGDIYARFRSTELPAAVESGGGETELSTSCSNLPNEKKLGERELQSSSNHM
ncbi:hypothetical protein AXF42_Ash000165 [Apostasia shenzhenica]|uniref:Uncharacterized protein n=1 Tax=Apostasia shenzhenica TaxID=1088818 RepID=A0A2I0AFK7_9ASPA|nr:hypothetical protein AXF42_Ash000165 [Apostasia shenzhenica]